MQIQELRKLLNKKSRKETSGAASKLSAKEWNTLVQGLIDHYELLSLDAVNNRITIKDSSGIGHIYELVPYLELIWNRPQLVLPTTGKINNTNYNLNNIPAVGGDLTITFSYTQTNNKGESYNSGGDISYTDFDNNFQTIPNNGKLLTVTIAPNTENTTKQYTLNVVVTREGKESFTNILTITQKAYDPEADIDQLLIKVLDGYSEEQVLNLYNNLYNNINADSVILNYIPNNSLTGATKYRTYKKDDGVNSHLDEYTIDLSTGNSIKIICVLVRNRSSFKYNANFPISNFSNFVLENIPYNYNNISYYCTLIVQDNFDLELKLIINDK